MRKGWMVGLAIGVVAGALLAECSQPVSNLVAKGKQAVKDKLGSMSGSESDDGADETV